MLPAAYCLLRDAYCVLPIACCVLIAGCCRPLVKTPLKYMGNRGISCLVIVVHCSLFVVTAVCLLLHICMYDLCAVFHMQFSVCCTLPLDLCDLLPASCWLHAVCCVLCDSCSLLPAAYRLHKTLPRAGGTLGQVSLPSVQYGSPCLVVRHGSTPTVPKSVPCEQCRASMMHTLSHCVNTLLLFDFA